MKRPVNPDDLKPIKVKPSTSFNKKANSLLPHSILALLALCLGCGFIKPDLWELQGFNTLVSALCGAVGAQAIRDDEPW